MDVVREQPDSDSDRTVLEGVCEIATVNLQELELELELELFVGRHSDLDVKGP